MVWKGCVLINCEEQVPNTTCTQYLILVKHSVPCINSIIPYKLHIDVIEYTCSVIFLLRLHIHILQIIGYLKIKGLILSTALNYFSFSEYTELFKGHVIRYY